MSPVASSRHPGAGTSTPHWCNEDNMAIDARRRGKEIYTFREGKSWIAAWVRFDLVAQGATEREAVDVLMRTIACQAIWDAIDGNLTTFGSARKPTRALLQRWRRSHLQTHSN
jgi:hypothetical protein